MPQPLLFSRLLLAALAGSLMLGCSDLPINSGPGQTGAQSAQMPSAKLVMAELKASLKRLQQEAGAQNSAPASYRIGASEWTSEESNKAGYLKSTRHLVTSAEDVASVRYVKSGEGPRILEQTDTVTKSATRKPGQYKVIITLTAAEGSPTTYEQSSTFTPAGSDAPTSSTLSATIDGGNISFVTKGTLPDGSKLDLSFVIKSIPAVELNMKGDITSAVGKTIGLDFRMGSGSNGSLSVEAAKDFNMVFDLAPNATPPITGKVTDDQGSELGKFVFATTSHTEAPLKATLKYNDSSKASEELDFTIFDDIAAALRSLSLSITDSTSSIY